LELKPKVDNDVSLACLNFDLCLFFFGGNPKFLCTVKIFGDFLLGINKNGALEDSKTWCPLLILVHYIHIRV
jgi:hypothetical protein